MSTFFSLLFFVFLGVAASSVLEYRAGNATVDSSHAFNSTLGGSSNASNITLDGSERIGRFYTALFTELVKANDFTNLDSNLQDSFSFSTCTKRFYPKEKFLEIVRQEKQNLTMKFERSTFTSSSDIKVYVTMKVLGDRIAAYFMLHELHKGSWQWHEGRCLAQESYSAPRRSFSASLAGNATDNFPHASNSTLGGSPNAFNITLDGSERIGRFYTALFTELVKANDFTNLDWNLHDSFSFSTCTKRFYAKDKFLEIVRQEKKNLTMKFERSTFTSSSDIKVYVTMKVLGDRIAAYFMLHEIQEGRWQWLGGRCLARESYSASRRSFSASFIRNGTNDFPHASNNTLGGSSNASNITLDGSERIGRFYTALFNELVKANDISNLSWNIRDSFSFSTCTKRSYAKEKFLEIVLQEKKNLTMKFERSTFTSSSDIKVYVTMKVLGDRIAAYFMLHEIQEGRWQWLGGRCLARESYSASRRFFSAPLAGNANDNFPHAFNSTLGGSSNASNITLDGSERIGRFYTALFTELVKANDFTNLDWNLQDSFSFSTCTKRFYPKEKFLEIVRQEKKNLTMKFERSTFTSSSDIKVYVTMKVLRDRIAAYFMLHELHKGSWQWLGGRCLARESYSSPRRSFSASLAGNATDDFPHASNSTLGGSSNASNTAPNVTNANSTDHIAETYTMFFNEYVKGKDLTSIADKIHDDFWFKGCKRNYDKRSVLEIIHNLPRNEKFALELVNSKWVNDNEMRILVILHAFGQKIVASLQLRKGYVGYEWVGGRAFNCSH